MNNDLQKETKRLVSLDVLRGMDMFFIMGGDSMFIGLASLFPLPFFKALASQMHHAEWQGMTFEDLIFPLFLFIAGISFPFSIEKQRLNGSSERQIYLKIVKRGFVLFLLGLVYNGLLDFDFDNMRYASVLGRIGIAWMFASFIFMKLKMKWSIAAILLLWLGYWCLVFFVPSPTGNGDPYSIDGCIVGYIDRMLLPGKLYIENRHDPEGLLGTIPAIGTALLGMVTGGFVKLKSNRLTDIKKVVILFSASIVLMLSGILWGQYFPIIKNIWSSSFACLAGGISVFLFAAVYYIVDIKNFRNWIFFFRIIGLNSITIYLAQYIIDFRYTSGILFGGIVSMFPESCALFLQSVFYILLCWLFLYMLYKNKIFLKV